MATEGADLKAAEAGAAPPSYVEAKDVAPPPYYGSLFGELKQAKENSDGQVDFVKTCCGPCCGTCCRILGGYVACTICLGIFLAIPIAMIAVGHMRRNVLTFFIAVSAITLGLHICRRLYQINVKREQHRNTNKSNIYKKRMSIQV